MSCVQLSEGGFQVDYPLMVPVMIIDIYPDLTKTFMAMARDYLHLHVHLHLLSVNRRHLQIKNNLITITARRS